MKLDDNSLMEGIERLDPAKLIRPCRRQARTLLLRGGLDYECRVLKRGLPGSGAANANAPQELPGEMFFDLLSDSGHHQLYRADTVFVRQGLTSKIADAVRLEESAGAFSPLFTGKNSAMLVADGYYIFLPHERQGGHWPEVQQAMDAGTLYPLVNWENARRGIPPTNTQNAPGFAGKPVSISFCSRDFPVVVRIVRELHRRKRQYRLFLRPFDGVGGTPEGNSGELIKDAQAVLAVVSTDYLERAVDAKTYIAIEVRAMHDRAEDIPIVPLGVDRRSELQQVKMWDWAQMNESWRQNQPVISEDLPLRNSSEETLRAEITEALNKVEQWKKP
jgi:hypothetical protein